MYKVNFTNIARQDALELEKSEPQAFAKASKLIKELESHPMIGTGHPEQLKGLHVATWSRRINKKHRMVYEIHEMQILVLVISICGHYQDK